MRYYYEWSTMKSLNLRGWMVFDSRFTTANGDANPICICTLRSYARKIKDVLNADDAKYPRGIKAAREE